MDVTLHPGETLDGKYRIERELGAGGMASVFQVMHLQLGERAAIKLLRSDVAHLEGVVERFSREARAMSRLKSEHVARVQDVGKLPTGQPYMVMEYLEGSDLSDAIQARGAFATQEAVDLILQACEAIAEAHARGIVHRDLKPSNLFLTNRTDGTPVLKVLDFGISKISTGASASAMSLTQTQALLGSPLYMAPEQIASARDADERADVWGIGTVLYEMLAGLPPFYAETLRHLQYKILNETPPSIRVKRPDVPEALEAVLNDCLAKEPEDRFEDMGALARALAPFATERGRPYADRVCGIVSRAHTLAAPSGQRTARLVSVEVSKDDAVGGPATLSLSDQMGHEPTFDVSAQGADAGSAPGAIPLEGTHGAWGGTQKRASRSRVGIVAAGLVGIAALTILVLASVRYVSGDASATTSSPPASAPTIEPMSPVAAPSLVEPSALATSVASAPSASVASAAPELVPSRTAPVDGKRGTGRRAPKDASPSATTGPSNGNAGGLFDTRK